jgi:hypothetical protein
LATCWFINQAPKGNVIIALNIYHCTISGYPEAVTELKKEKENGFSTGTNLTF